jgi:hypothetical protein
MLKTYGEDFKNYFKGMIQFTSDLFFLGFTK